MLISRINVVTGALRMVGAVICDFIYTIIAGLYQLFTVIARLDVFSAVDIKPIYQRVTMILTIVMTFYITFQFVKYAIEPDTFTDKEKGVGNILKRIVIVVVLLAFMPNIFDLGLKLQNRIIETQVISKAIIGRTEGDFKTYGNEFSANVLNLFYYVDDKDAEGACYNDNGSDCNEARTAVKENIQRLRQKGICEIAGNINIPSVKSLLRGDVKPAIKFNGILAIVAGGFMAYILVMYCIDLGTRYFQLLFLQLISPIAIMGYLLPKKDGLFQKWTKQVITTYIDVFLRIAIMSFVMLLISTLGNAFDNNSIFSTIPEGVSGIMKTLVYIALVIGLLSFAKKAPKLLSDLFPSAGSAGIGFGLGAKDRLEPIKKTTSSVVGTGLRVAGGVGGAIAGGMAGAGFREKLRYAAAGAKSGYSKDNKGFATRRIERAKEAVEERKYKDDEIERNAPEGVSREEAIRNATKHKEHYANIAAEQDRKSKLFDVPSSSMDAINKNIDEFKQIKALKQAKASAEARGASAAEIKSLDGQYKSAVQAVRGAVAKSMDSNGNFDEAKFKSLVESGAVKFTYKELDENGFEKAGGIKQDYTLMVDPGDYNHVGSVARSIDNEYKKIVATTDELLADASTKAALKQSRPITISLDINGTKKNVVGSADAWIKGVVTDADTGSEIQLTEEQRRAIYSEYVNKFKDVMKDPKGIYEDSDDFKAAHAYKDGAGGSSGGGSKK